ncbi:MAG: TPM domain-containing protein [Deltaproteobacteria bacterium]|nr:TPM domain-containing protein [Deltaproteobacteria bacterium]
MRYLQPKTRRAPLEGSAAWFALLALALVLGALLSPLARPAHAAELAYPRPQGAVGDYAKVIGPEYTQQIENLATELWQKTGAAVVVATVPTLGDNSIEEAAVQLFARWGIGKKGEDKGLLLLVAVKERKLRLEVGYGLEGLITDATAGAIRDQFIVPYLKKGQYGAGLYFGAAAAAQIIAKDAGVTLTGVPDAQLRQSSRGFSVFGLILFVLAGLWFLRRMRGGRGGPGGGPGGGGNILPAMILGSMMGSSMGGRHDSGFGGFGGGFGGFGGGMSGGGGASGGF